MTSPDQTNVAFLGLGTMGAAMAANLARAGFPLTAWNRTPGRAPELADLGVEIAETPAAAVADADIAVICVSDTPDVEAVLSARPASSKAPDPAPSSSIARRSHPQAAGISRRDCASEVSRWSTRPCRAEARAPKRRR